MVRAPPCHGGGHGFKSRLGRTLHFSSALFFYIMIYIMEVRVGSPRSGRFRHRSPSPSVTAIVDFTVSNSHSEFEKSRAESSLRSDIRDLPTSLCSVGPSLYLETHRSAFRFASRNCSRNVCFCTNLRFVRSSRDFASQNNATCRRGGTGRRPGLKIPWVVIPVPVRSRSPAQLMSREPRFYLGLTTPFFIHLREQ